MVRAGQSPADPAEQFEPSEQCIRNWVKQADRDSGKRQDGLTSAEKEEFFAAACKSATFLGSVAWSKPPTPAHYTHTACSLACRRDGVSARIPWRPRQDSNLRRTV